MKYRSPDEIREKVYSRHWRPRELKLAMGKLGDEVVFEALYGIFLDRSREARSFEDQEIFGVYLYELAPKTNKELKSLVKNSLDNWNYSVEQFPWYFRDAFGIEALKAVLLEIELEGGLNEYEIGAINIFRRWTGISNG